MGPPPRGAAALGLLLLPLLSAAGCRQVLGIGDRRACPPPSVLCDEGCCAPEADGGGDAPGAGDGGVDAPPACVAGEWTFEKVGTVGYLGGYNSLGLDRSVGVHVSYFDNSDRSLRYAHKPKGGVWEVSPLFLATGDSQGYSSLAVDAADGVHVSYFDNTTRSLMYRYKPGAGGWGSPSKVEEGSQTGYDNSLAVDESGRVHVAYRGKAPDPSPDFDVKYATRPAAGSWDVVVVDRTGDTSPWWTSLALDGSGGVHISYYDHENTNLKYAYLPTTNGTWQVTTPDAEGDVGFSNSVAVDTSGTVHLAYADYSNAALKYAKKPAGGSWAMGALDAAGDRLEFPSLATDASRGLHVSYYRRSAPAALKYGHRRADGDWEINVVQPVGDTDYTNYTSLKLDRAGGVHVSYCDGRSREIWYAYRCP
jgi:hypothetical protein